MREELGVKNNIPSQGAVLGQRVPNSPAGTRRRGQTVRVRTALLHRVRPLRPTELPSGGAQGRGDPSQCQLEALHRGEDGCPGPGEPFPCGEQQDGVSSNAPGTPGAAEGKVGLLGLQHGEQGRGRGSLGEAIRVRGARLCVSPSPAPAAGRLQDPCVAMRGTVCSPLRHPGSSVADAALPCEGLLWERAAFHSDLGQPAPGSPFTASGRAGVWMPMVFSRKVLEAIRKQTDVKACL